MGRCLEVSNAAAFKACFFPSALKVASSVQSIPNDNFGAM